MYKMFLKSALFYCVISYGVAAHSAPYMMTGSGFSAPSACSDYIGNAQEGDIVFDNCENQFEGFDGSDWVPLSGNLVPTPPKVTRLTSGTAATFNVSTTPAPLYIKVRMVGGGGGGAGSSVTSSSAGTNGNATSFSTFATAGGGQGGASASINGGEGGTPSFTPTTDVTLAQSLKGQGGAGGTGTNSGNFAPGGQGGGQGGGDGRSTTGRDAGANTGAGGAGGGINVAGVSGAGGGQGATLEFIIANPSTSYTYTVGASVSGGSAGTGTAGGAGAAGEIVITEYFQ